MKKYLSKTAIRYNKNKLYTLNPLMKDTIIPLLYSLIKIPSISSDIEKLNEIIDFVENEFSQYKNAIIKRYEFNSKPSIVIQNFEWLEAEIILNGHLDVVPPSEDSQFHPYEEDGKIFARWSWDMKAGDAIMITLMKDIFENNFTDKKVCLILTCDEETGWEDGAGEIVKLWYTASQWVIVPDSWSLTSIVTSEKWIIDFGVKVIGKSWHSSRPWISINALERTFELYKELKNTIETESKLTEDNWYWWSTVQMTMLEWWTATNVIPETARAHFNIRVTEDFTMDWLKTELQEIVKSYGTMSEYQEGSLVYTDPESEFVQNYLASCEKVLGFSPEIKKEHGASDGRYFAEKGMPLLLHLPTCKNIHTKWEYVEKEAIFQIYDCYKVFIFWK